MKVLLILNIILCGFWYPLKGQTRAVFEEQRDRTLNEISFVDKLLKTASKEKEESINALKIIGNKLRLRETVIKVMREEIELISGRIELNTLAIIMMESDLIELKNDYSLAIINSYKSRKLNTELIYVLSARDFNQGYKRLKYLQHAAKFRRNEAEIIIEIKEQIESSKKRMEIDLSNISDLKLKEEYQKGLLQSEHMKKERMIISLASKEKQLKKELEEKKRIAKKIEAEIAKLIEEERKRKIKTDMTPEEKLIGENFSDNKGLLPWPVERGIITGHFGIQQNDVLKNVTENNIGIEITSYGETPVRAVFKGEVGKVFAINGANWTIIIKHGKYLSVYNNIINVKVKTGDKVDTKQYIGDIFCEKKIGNNSTMKFLICEESKILNPELWISQKTDNYVTKRDN
jgi:murein hydrolase activator